MVVCGDALEVMKAFPAKSIDMVITSPPYWGLRDYGFEQIFGDKDCKHEWGSARVEHDALRYRGHNANVGSNENPEIHPGKEGSGGNYCQKCDAWKGQLGLEPTPEMYIEHLTEIFNEVKRVLKKEGTLWLNMGDSYMGSNQGYGQHGPPTTGFQDVKKGYYAAGEFKRTPLSFKHPTLKAKCLCMIPERLAWSLIQNGWILRNKIIWYKPNAMPSSVTDRFSNRWEYLFMFNKNSKTILWRHEKTKEWVKEKPLGTKGIKGIDWEWRDVGSEYSDSDTKIEVENAEQFNSPRGRKYRQIKRKKVSLWNGFTYYFDLDAVREPYTEPMNRWGGDNLVAKGESSWDKGTGQVTYRDRNMRPNPDGKNPGDVFEIGADTRPKAKLGNPSRISGGGARCQKDSRWTPPEGKRPIDFWRIATQPFPEAHFAVFPEKLCEKPIKAGCPEDGIVLDPFCGAGTALLVAKEMKRRFIGIDIKQEYCEMCEKRLAQGVL